MADALFAVPPEEKVAGILKGVKVKAVSFFGTVEPLTVAKAGSEDPTGDRASDGPERP